LIRRLTVLLPIAALCACARLVSSATTGLTDDLATAIRSHDDPETVREGAPAYLLMADGLIARSPDDSRMLLSAASLYGSYATAFVEDPVRARRLAARALEYGERALCVDLKKLCAARNEPYESFTSELAGIGRDGVPTLFGFAAAWAGWVQVNSDDWKAIAEIPKIEAAMQRVLELDESYERGGAHLYLGVLSTLRPASMGGRPEEGRAHFERALELSDGRDLMVQVLFAESYGRLVFDRELHDELLQQVLAADPREPGLTLSNTLAQERAQALLASGNDYF
jgi:hypothetical protein